MHPLNACWEVKCSSSLLSPQEEYDAKLHNPDKGRNLAIVPLSSPITKKSSLDNPFVDRENQTYFAVTSIQS
jgi:hypothetical protein